MEKKSRLNNNILKRLDGKKGSIFSEDGELLKKGRFEYTVETGNEDTLYLSGKKIPINLIQQIIPRLYGSTIVFVNSSYDLTKRRS